MQYCCGWLTLYRNYFILSGQAIQINQTYFSSLIPALVYAKYFNQNTESAMYLAAQTNPNIAKEINTVGTRISEIVNNDLEHNSDII